MINNIETIGSEISKGKCQSEKTNKGFIQQLDFLFISRNEDNRASLQKGIEILASIINSRYVGL